MNYKLIIEIKRVKTLMGIDYDKNSIIGEQFFQFLRGVGRSFLKNQVNSVTSGFKRIYKIGNEEISKFEYDELMLVSKGQKSLDEVSSDIQDKVLKLLWSTAKKDPKFLQEVTDEVYVNIMKTVKLSNPNITEFDYLGAIRNKMKNGYTEESIIKKLYPNLEGTEFEIYVDAHKFRLKEYDVANNNKTKMREIPNLNVPQKKKEDVLNSDIKKSDEVGQNISNISKNIDSGDDPQAYLKNLSQDELAARIDYSEGWVSNGIYPNIMSGWKFHVFGEDLVDSVFLKEKLWPVTKKWNAHAKVGGLKHTDGVSYPSMQQGGVQYGKQGATIYIPVDVINNGKQQEMLSDIQNAIAGYKKGGDISGDQAITPAIHYRYELLGPVPKEGIDMKTYGVMYNKNSGGSYKPYDVDDLFTKKQ